MALQNCPLTIAIAPAITYRELHLYAGRAAATLALTCKVGDCIALQADLNWRTIACLLGAWRLSLNVALFAPHLPRQARDTHLSLLAPTLIVEDSAKLLDTHRFYEGEFDLTLPALMLLTSGSSGHPKWASFSLSQLFESARTVAAVQRAKPGDRWLLSVPLHHVAGLGVLLRALLTTGTLLFEDKSLPPAERICQAHADFASLVPTQLYRLLRQPLPKLSTHFLIGGAPLAEELYRTAVARDLRLSLTYGLTEMSSTVLLTETPTWREASPWLGLPLPGRHIHLTSEGELLVGGTSLFNGYGFPPLKPPAFFPTGDVGSFDPELGWSIQGRKDFQFMSGGDNIQPEEIEAALLSHPEVEAAIVVPKPDAEFGARPAAFVRTAAPYLELVAYLSERLPKFKIPVLFQPLEESNGFKPSRKQLAAILSKKI